MTTRTIECWYKNGPRIIREVPAEQAIDVFLELAKKPGIRVNLPIGGTK